METKLSSQFKNQFVLTTLILLMFNSCDYVDNAVQPATTTGGNNNPNIIYKKALVEDFTGHKCGNCPAAAVELKNLEASLSGKVIPVAVHAGFYALTNATYTTNFQTTEGNDYDTQFGNSSAGNPNGLINRVGNGSASFIKQWSSWSTAVSQEIAIPAKFQIKIKNNFNSTANSVSTDVTVKALANLTGQYKLVVLLTEDSIIAEQLDYSKPTGQQFIANYQFNHVLRGAINSTWGDVVFSSTINTNDSIVKTYANYSINTNYKPAKCHVVAYVYDANSASPTYYEVMQAEEEKVK